MSRHTSTREREETKRTSGREREGMKDESLSSRGRVRETEQVKGETHADTDTDREIRYKAIFRSTSAPLMPRRPSSSSLSLTSSSSSRAHVSLLLLSRASKRAAADACFARVKSLVWKDWRQDRVHSCPDAPVRWTCTRVATLSSTAFHSLSLLYYCR